MILAQLTCVARPLAPADGVDELSHSFLGAIARFRGGHRHDAAGFFAFGFDEVLARDRCRSPPRWRGATTPAAARHATRRARRRSTRPRSRDRGRAGSSGTPARRISTPRANEWTSARRAECPVVRRTRRSHAPSSNTQRNSIGVTIRRVVVHRWLIGQARQRAANRHTPRLDGGFRWTGSPATTIARIRSASTLTAPAHA